MAQCRHCADCKRATGTDHLSQTFFAEEAVHIEGEASSYRSIAESAWFEPQVILYTDYKQKWDLTSDKVPNSPRMPS